MNKFFRENELTNKIKKSLVIKYNEIFMKYLTELNHMNIYHRL